MASVGSPRPPPHAWPPPRSTGARRAWRVWLCPCHDRLLRGHAFKGKGEELRGGSWLPLALEMASPAASGPSRADTSPRRPFVSWRFASGEALRPQVPPETTCRESLWALPTSIRGFRRTGLGWGPWPGNVGHGELQPADFLLKALASGRLAGRLGGAGSEGVVTYTRTPSRLAGDVRTRAPPRLRPLQRAGGSR